MRLGHFDPPGPLDRIPASDVCSPYAIALGREGTVQSAVLVKNLNNTLPWDSKVVESAAVIGPNGNLSYAMADYYAGNNCGGNYPTVTDAIKSYVKNTVSLYGVPSVKSDDVSGIPEAVEVAERVDRVVLVLGTDLTMMSEGTDAVNLTHSYGQSELLHAVSEARDRSHVCFSIRVTIAIALLSIATSYMHGRIRYISPTFLCCRRRSILWW